MSIYFLFGIRQSRMRPLAHLVFSTWNLFMIYHLSFDIFAFWMRIDVPFQIGEGRKRHRIQVEKILEHIIGSDVLHHVGGD